MKRIWNVFLRAFFFTHSRSSASYCEWEEEQERYERARSHTQHITQANIFPLSFSSFRSSIVLCESHIQHKTVVCSNRKTQQQQQQQHRRIIGIHMLHRHRETEREPKQITVLEPAQTVCSFVLTRTERLFFRSLARSLARSFASRSTTTTTGK